MQHTDATDLQLFDGLILLLYDSQPACLAHLQPCYQQSQLPLLFHQRLIGFSCQPLSQLLQLLVALLLQLFLSCLYLLLLQEF